MIHSRVANRVLQLPSQVLKRVLLLICLLSLAGIANTEDSTISERNTATDISSKITEKDLASARELIGKYLVNPVPEKLEVAGALAVQDFELLQVVFDSPDDSFGQDAKYTARLLRQAQDEAWELNEVGIYHSQHVVPGEDTPILSRGAIRAETAAELVEHVSSFLESSGAGRMRITRISSNALPPMYSFPASMGEAPKVIVYHVHVETLEPAKPYVPPDAKPGNVVMASSSSRGFIVWLERDESGRLVTTDASSVGLPEEDVERLQLLRSKLERPEDPDEAERRIEAVRLELPDAARDAGLLGMSRTLDGQVESLRAHFAETAISDRRRGTPTVSCSRVFGTEAWRCHYRVSGVSQSVPGQQAPLHLWVKDLDEEQVDDTVHQLRASMAGHPLVDPSNGPMEIIIISPDRDSLHAQIRYGLGLYKVRFRYDGSVAIESVEPLHHMGAVKR